MNFYALKEDVRNLMHFLFEESDVRIVEAYSEPEKELREFRSFYELSNAFDLGIDPYGNSSQVFLQLWSPGISEEVETSRIELRPTKGRPHTFRYRLCGIGLMQLQLGGRYGNHVTPSYFGHWSEAGARQRSGGDADAVDWKALSTLSGRIQRHIRKQRACAKVIGRPILPEAFTALQGGADLWAGYTTFHSRSPEIQLLRNAAV